MLVARWNATERRHYELTWERTEQHLRPWTGDDDRYVADHPEIPARDVGLALGRTSTAVRRRRVVLHRHPRALVQTSGRTSSGPSFRTDETSGVTA